MSPSKDDYMVACICSRGACLGSVEAVLDNIYPTDPLVNRKRYILGSICGHNIVIAITDGSGPNEVAKATRDLLDLFPKIRFGLLVGLGSALGRGADGDYAEPDIKLGDVVVSQSANGHGGVARYVMEKTDGKLLQTTWLTEPPTLLRSIITSQAAQRHRKGSRVQQYLSDITQRISIRNVKSIDSEAEQAQVFEPIHGHQGMILGDVCSADNAVQRKAHPYSHPTIHYGTIALVNEHVASVIIQANLAKAGVLSVDTELTGFLPSLPSLVIRGIWNYLGCRENHEWRTYAAATAAAYMKELLSVIPSEGVNELSLASDLVKRPAICNLPFSRNARFTGREVYLRRLENAIISREHTRIIVSGIAGIGKTALALELAYRVQRECPECSIIWITATSEESIRAAYSDVAQLAKIFPHDDKVDVLSLVRQHFSQESVGQWLMIFDGADDHNLWSKDPTDTGQHGLGDFLPISSSGCIVFTTRSKNIAQDLCVGVVTGVLREEILEMKVDAAIELLSSLSGCKPAEEGLKLIAKALCFHPLALVLAGAYMGKRAVSATTYLMFLRSRTWSVNFLAQPDAVGREIPPATKNAIIVAFYISFEEICSNNPMEMFEYLSLISCLEPEYFPKALLPTRDS